MRLSDEEKQEVIDLYWGDFYAMNIIDWFTAKNPRAVKRALKQTLKDKKISRREWKRICKGTNNLEVYAGDVYDDVALDTMWILLEKAQIDPYQPFNMAIQH